MLNFRSFRFDIGEASLTSIPSDQDWEAAFEYLTWMQRNIYWWIGDVSVYAERHLGEEASQIYPMHVSERLVSQCRWMAERFPPHLREKELSWSHHQVVSKLPEKVASALLRKAVENRWDTKALREEVSINWS